MIVAIIGGREFTDFNFVVDELDNIEGIEHIVSGGARGADTMAVNYAKLRHISWHEHKAEWSKYGRAAGPIRNKKVVDDADTIIAFWNGRSAGTRNAIQQAREQGKKVIIIQADY